MIVIPIITTIGAIAFAYQSYKQGWQAKAYNLYAALLVVATVVILIAQHADR